MPKVKVKFKNKIKLKKKLFEKKSLLKVRLKKNKLHFNKVFDVFFSFKYNNFFIKKLFLILVKKGFKIKIYKIYFNWLNIIKFKLLKKNINKHVFVYCLLNKILPKMNYSNLYKKGKIYSIPNIKKSEYKQNLKLGNLIASWVKKSFNKRKEKTFILKFFSEISDIKLNKGGSIKFKKEFYRNFYLNKKYYRFKKWI